MSAVLEERLFHLTGTATGTSLRPLGRALLRPALFAPYPDLARLRHAYPLVLVDDARIARPLSEIVDDALTTIAPRGPAGERLRRAAGRLEREIRELVAAGVDGTLVAVAEMAVERLTVRGGDPLRADLAAVTGALDARGQLLGCASGTAARYVAHAWRLSRRRAAAAMRERIERLLVRISDLDRADLLRSAAGVRPRVLRSGVGAPHRALFDFELMAHLLATPAGASGMSERRRRRIERAEEVLRGQTLFDAARAPTTFHALDAAHAAAKAAAPTLAQVARALAVAELESTGRYDEALHDAWVASLGDVGSDELAWSPDRLVALGPETATSTGRARILEALASGIPLKVVVEIDDALGPHARLALAAAALGDAYVVQASAAALPAMADSVAAACEFQGPALIAVFGGALREDLAPYVVAAAATASRAFPTFVHDPSSPGRWRLGAHPQADREWPVERFSYADERLQRVSVDVAFTPADLALCDPRWASSFAIVERARWDGLAPVADVLHGAADSAAAAPPAVLAVDPDQHPHRLVVDDRLVRAARAATEGWRRLRELAREREEPVAVTTIPAAVDGPSGAQTEAPEPEGVVSPAEGGNELPYIETARCSSCNECTLLNPRMFKYNENKQAYLADARAGTYRDLVEAAERCQVAIIHPGKPLDPGEPDLDALLERARSFAA